MPDDATVLSETRIIFMGTPDFATPGLEALHTQGAAFGWRLSAVVTQPDRPAGRGKQQIPSPVKAYAIEHDLPVLQPVRLRKAPEVIEALAALAPDLIVVAAYGLILPPALLEIPTFGCINVHASLLPAYRGASPITAAILDGRTETGVSIMLMDEGMDTGPILSQTQHPIRTDDTTATLGARLADLGADLLVDTLPRWLRGEIAPERQQELPGEVSVCGLIKKEAGRIDWRRSAQQIERMTRAYAPWPSAYTTWRGQPFKIWQARTMAGRAEPGVVIDTAQGPAVGSGDGLLLLLEVQPAGKRRMAVEQFLHGAPEFVGQRLPVSAE